MIDQEPFSEGQELVVNIEKMAITGEGVARFHSAVIFIPRGAPGDTLRVKITQAKKNHYRAQILEVMNPGPERIKPICNVADRCGGCTWQHLSSAEQLHQKQILLKEVLSRFLHEGLSTIQPIRPSPEPFYYRNRIQPRWDGAQFGFNAWKSHDFVAIKDCHLVEEPLRMALKTPEVWNRKVVSKNLPENHRIELYLNEENSVQVRALKENTEDSFFSQVNRFQNTELVDYVVGLSLQKKYLKIYDLYSGSGNFTFPLSDKHKSAQVVGVELSSELTKRAQSKAQDLRISRQFLEFYTMSVDYFLARHVPSEADLVVLDPPRAGASAFVIASLAAAAPQSIIYISCHPVSLGRDLALLEKEASSRRKKVRIKSIQPFEMFPQTSHLETVVELGIDSL